jgi:DDE superfamily endonuclease
MTTTGKATCTNLSTVLDNKYSHDDFSRLLKQSTIDSKFLWQESKVYVRELSCSNSLNVLVIDDCIQEKIWSDESELICWHFDHTKQRSVKGVNFISSLLVCDDVSIPVGVEFIKKNIITTNFKTSKQQRKSSKTKNELFREMVSSANERMSIDYVAADSWYSSAENMNALHCNEQLKFVMAIKSNRKIALSKEAKFAGQYLGIESLELKDTPQEIWLKELDFPLLLLKQVFKNGDDVIGEIYLVTNDLNLDANKMTTIYKKRWKVEEYHKSLKQNAAFAKSPTHTIKTQTNHFIASILAFMKYEVLKIKHHTNHFALKSKIMIAANKAALITLRDLAELNQKIA